MTTDSESEKAGWRRAPIVAGRLCAPVVIEILAVRAALPALLRQ